jgi:hypothetical protein
VKKWQKQKKMSRALGTLFGEGLHLFGDSLHLFGLAWRAVSSVSKALGPSKEI